MRKLCWLLFLACALVSSNCLAWDAKGHQAVGAVADAELGKNAKAMVQSLIGMPLSKAGPWLDCVKDVKGKPGSLHYVEDSRYAAGCRVFWTDSEKAAMVDFASRNLDNCPTGSAGNPCSSQYHFSDVDVSAAAPVYRSGEPGTNNYDVVNAINAAVAVLRDQPPASPFEKSMSKREALFVIAHLVGDLHQPLHVGAIYLAKDGSVAAASSGDDNDPAFTRGGNFIFVGSDKLHALWDHVTPKVASQAKTIAHSLPANASAGGVETWPQAWADEALIVAKPQLEDLKYGPSPSVGAHHWPVIATPNCSSRCYARGIAQVQAEQVAAAGRHMADLLNAIWP